MGFDGPSPDYVPDVNTDLVEAPGTVEVDLTPLGFLTKLEKVQEQFDRQIADVRFMLGQMETRAVNAETALQSSEKTIESLVGFNASLVDKVTDAEKAAKKKNQTGCNYPKEIGNNSNRSGYGFLTVTFTTNK